MNAQILKTMPHPRNTILLLLLSTTIWAQNNVGIGIDTPAAKLHIIGDSNSIQPVLSAHVNFIGLSDIPAIYGNSQPAYGWGVGGQLVGGFIGAYASANGGDYPGNAYGVYGISTGIAGTRIGVYGSASGGAYNWAGYFEGAGYIRDSLGIGVLFPVERLDVAGAINLGTSSGNNVGTIRYANGLFEGNTTGTASGWQAFNGPWVKASLGNYYLSPVYLGGKVAIGDSLFQTPAKLSVWTEPYPGGGAIGVQGINKQNGNVIAEGRLGYQFASLGNPYIFNFGVYGSVDDDSILSPQSFGVAGVNMEHDSCNYGGHFVVQSYDYKNIGVYGFAQWGAQNWAGYLDGDTYVKDRLMIGTDTANAKA